jgi:hypothetical protein
MPIDEISRGEWNRFCGSFSMQHKGWLADVEVPEGASDPNLNQVGTLQVRRLAHGPLSAVCVDRMTNGEDCIRIVTEDESARPAEHVISSPTRLRLEYTDAGADQALYIDSAHGETTAIRFPVTAPMEMLDGYVSE